MAILHTYISVLPLVFALGAAVQIVENCIGLDSTHDSQYLLQRASRVSHRRSREESITNLRMPYPPYIQDLFARLKERNFANDNAHLQEHKANDPRYCPDAQLRTPSRCPYTEDYWPRSELLAALPIFALVYARRPPVDYRASPNHAFALWFTIKQLQPKFVIESGTYTGGTTWMIKSAAPQAHIFSLDPLAEDVLEFRDSTKTQYFMGARFHDLTEIDWDKLIPEPDRNRTLVVLDDHQSVMSRVPYLANLGFVHLWYGSNFHYDEPGQDAYSFNTICAPLAEHRSYGNSFVIGNENISFNMHKQHQKLVSEMLDVYYEFPAIWNGACKDANELLHENQLAMLGLPAPQEARFSYYTSNPPYVKLVGPAKRKHDDANLSFDVASNVPTKQAVMPAHDAALHDGHAPVFQAKGNSPLFCPPRELSTPSFCIQGSDLWTRAELLAALPEFVQDYRERPYFEHSASPNHAFSLWFTIRQLQPKYIIESGTGKGGGTWMIRQAAGPDVMIFCFDPAASVEHKDVGKAQYFVGKAFTDIAQVDWANLIPMGERSSTLVVLDDHTHAHQRVRTLRSLGFLHLWYGSNYRYGEPGQDMYSFSTSCSSLAEKRAEGGKITAGNQQISVNDHRQIQQFFSRTLDVYFEYPAVWNMACSDERELLNESGLSLLGLPSPQNAMFHYYTSHPAYVRLFAESVSSQEQAGAEQAKPQAPSLNITTNGSEHKANNQAFCPPLELSKPSFCSKPPDLWGKSELLESLSLFTRDYAQRPHVDYRASPNHAFSLWFTIKMLKPRVIIESGTYKGGGTWMIRQAAGPDGKIISLDPFSEDQLEYRDSGNTQYLMGKNFQELSLINWDEFIPLTERNSTLVVLDDHQPVSDRLATLLRLGFSHVWYGPNYRHGEPGQDVYSLNNICSPLAEQHAQNSNIRVGRTQISLDTHRRVQQDVSNSLHIYFEFPAIWNGACTDPTELVHEAELVPLGLPAPEDAKYHYYTSHPAYLQLKPSTENLLQQNHDRWQAPNLVGRNDAQHKANDPAFCPENRWSHPAHCPQGAEFWTRFELIHELKNFSDLYSHRPSVDYQASPNHAFSLWFTIRKLQPTFIIESGTHKGGATWLIRQAAGPNANIISMDPTMEHLEYQDLGRTQYFMGKSFEDLSHVNWDVLIPLSKRNETLVVLDDHQSASDRLTALLSLGFSHIWYGPNYRYGEPGQDVYSFNTICSPLAEQRAHNGTITVGNEQISLNVHRDIQGAVSKSLEVYFEFPAIWNGACIDQAELLQESELGPLGLPAPKEATYNYYTSHPAYLKLKVVRVYSQSTVVTIQDDVQQQVNTRGICPDIDLSQPSYCPQGENFWTRPELMSELKNFSSVFARQPTRLDYRASPNNAFSLWFTVRKLQPKFVIESGTFTGGATWMIRQAAGPDTHIFSIDPVDENHLEYRDAGRTQYFMGKKFQDLSQMSWDTFIPSKERNATLVVLDDHQHAPDRLSTLLRLGFSHVWYGPNYRYGEPAQDLYSFNIICSQLANQRAKDGSIVVGNTEHSVIEHRAMQEQVSTNLEVYFEFPAIWNGDCTDPTELIQQTELGTLGLPAPMQAKYHYHTSHPAYVRLRASIALADAQNKSTMFHEVMLNSNDPAFCPQPEQTRPVYCPHGHDFWSRSELLIATPEFASVYAQRPNDTDHASPNDAFSLWFTIKQLKPRYIVESGTHKGGATWMMRQAAGQTAQIMSFDPIKETLLQYKDEGNTQYFVGDNFKDISQINWDSLIPTSERHAALVVLDDDESALQRVAMLSKLGFLHVWYGPNYRYGEPGQHTYTFSAICSSLAETSANTTNDFLRLGSKHMSRSLHKQFQKAIAQSLEVYFEFPPLWNGACTDSSELMAQRDLSRIGLPSAAVAKYNYYTAHPAYIQLRKHGIPPQIELLSSSQHTTLVARGAAHELVKLDEFISRLPSKANRAALCPDPALQSPSRCNSGKDHWSRSELISSISRFAEDFSLRPVLLSGANPNYAFALWFTIKKLKPKLTVEIGRCATDGGTWLIRQAADMDSDLLCLDDRPTANLEHRDPGRTKYLTSTNLKNLSLLQWDALVPVQERRNALVVLHDHISAVASVGSLLDLGFVHLWYGPNYHYQAPEQDCYSFNAICTPLAERHLGNSDMNIGGARISAEDHRKNQDYVASNLEVYFEFPAIWNGACTDDQELLTKSDLEKMRLPAPEDPEIYFHTMHPGYIKLHQHAGA